MPISPLDFIESAKEILKIDNEAAYRTAVSRAYYSCYHFTADMASTLDDGGGGGMHERHIKKFTKSMNSGIKGVGYLLQQSHSLRVKADYDLDSEFGVSDAKLAILSAERLIDKVKEIT